ncbi:MAG: DUF3606 domain-containing protein, partial [Mesorhizobium sp.]
MIVVRGCPKRDFRDRDRVSAEVDYEVRYFAKH